MRSLVLVALLWSLARAVEGATIDSPPSLVRSFDCLLYNKYIGPQDETLDLVNVPVSVVDSKQPQAVGSLDCDAVRGTLVYLDHRGATWSMLDVLETALAVEHCGGLAFLRGAHNPNEIPASMGFWYYLTEDSCCKGYSRNTNIPVLVSWHADLAAVRDAVLRGETNVTATIAEVDANKWVAVFDNPAFFIFARVLLPCTNGLVALCALRAVVIHSLFLWRGFEPQRATILDSMRAHIVFAMCLQFLGCTIRATYCAMNPFFSNADLTYQESMYLYNISEPIQLPVIFVVSSVFRRMISMRRWVFAPKLRRQAVVAAVCLAVAVLEVVGGYGRATNTDFDTFLLFAILVASVTTLVALTVFLGAGIPFLLRMHEQHQYSKRKGSAAPKAAVVKVRVRFATSIVWGSVGLVMQIIGCVFAIGIPAVFYSPSGFALLSVMYYFGFTITAFFHTLAFAPLARVGTAKPSSPLGSLRQSSKRTPTKATPTVLVDNIQPQAREEPKSTGRGDEERGSERRGDEQSAAEGDGRESEWQDRDFNDGAFVVDASEVHSTSLQHVATIARGVGKTLSRPVSLKIRKHPV